MAAPSPPAVAPPPPPVLAPPPARLVSGRQLMEFDSPHDEVRHCCTQLLENLPDDEMLLSFYSPIPSIIQQDKVCGLVALEMAVSSSDFSRHPTTDQLLDDARKRGYTKQGEMFSAENLAELARDVAGCNCDVINTGLPDHVTILNHVTRGLPLLVPYDVGADNRPACQGGRKAHWAVISGAVLRQRGAPIDSTVDPECPKLHYCPSQKSPELDFQNLNYDGIFLLGKQGKSRYLGLWDYRTMMESNSNLTELPEFIRENLGEFVIPAAGISGGLNSQVLLIRPT